MAVTGLEAVRYAAPVTRVRGLYARLIDDGRWQALVDAESLTTAMTILQNSAYGESLFSTERGEALRRITSERQGSAEDLEWVERRLLAHSAENCLRAMSLTRGQLRTLIQVWWQHYELENLKAVFRGVERHMPPDEILRALIPLGEHTRLPWDLLAHEFSALGLVDRLADTHYVNPLRNAYPAYQRQGSLFPLEVALDIRYYRDLYRAIRQFGSDERHTASEVLGILLDILNTLWAFRYREYYGLSAEEVVNLTLWHTDRTDAELVREIALGASPREIVRQVFGENAVDLDAPVLSGAGTDWLPWLELQLYRHWRRTAHRQMAGYPFRLGAVLGYLVLQELEVRDLITLLEVKRMGWKPARIGERLIRRRE